MPAEADDYLDSALDIMEGNALHRDNIEWKAVRTEASRRAIGASAPTETYDAIRWALSQLKDDHSFFAPPVTMNQVVFTAAAWHWLACFVSRQTHRNHVEEELWARGFSSLGAQSSSSG